MGMHMPRGAMHMVRMSDPLLDEMLCRVMLSKNKKPVPTCMPARVTNPKMEMHSPFSAQLYVGRGKLDLNPRR